MKTRLSATLILGILLPVMAQVEEVTGKSRITDVTLYRTQAMVSREIIIGPEKGELAVIVEDLPAAIQADSLFATADDVNIRSVRFFTEYVAEKEDDDREEVRALEKQFKDLQYSLDKLQPRRELLATKKKFIQQLEGRYLAELGTTPTALGEKAVVQSGFDFRTIEEMTEFVFAQQQVLTEAGLELAAEERELRQKVEEIQGKMRELGYMGHTGGQFANQTVQLAQTAMNQSDSQSWQAENRQILRKATVYVAKKTDGEARLKLHYLVNGAGWNPTYNMRIDETSDGTLNIEYLAHVNQLTGEDWNSVALTLSTATPNMNADIPMLAPMWIRLVPREETVQQTSSDNNLLISNQDLQVTMNSKFQQFKGGKQQLVDYNYRLNDIAAARQKLEFDNRGDILRHWYKGVKTKGTGIAVEYGIPDTVTLASRRDNQMVQILTADVAGAMFYEAVPLLSDYVSCGIEAKNSLTQPLLAGKYSAFVDGQYVGSGNLPLTVTGQMLSLGFGSVPQLKCSRELVKKTGTKDWGRRTESYIYTISLDNFMDRPAKVRLLDRFPVTKDDGLKITLKQGADSLSKDGEYRDFQYPRGILRWDLELPPATSGSKATTFEYSYDVRFDSDMRISTEGEKIRRQVQEDLMEMELRMRK